ncbi:MAG: type II secretion system minor pseudopilin GspI [Mariprofundaceae bacterium]|nr:type II secretion system minor pseudopilin GspI [Mariprofundaceae bacterium]
MIINASAAKKNHRAQGFTLIEVLVALSIASFALVALMGRLGASADVQRSLSLHALSMNEARNLLAKDRLTPTVSNSEERGDVQVSGLTMHWRTWTEKTALNGFVRRNVAVQTKNEPEIVLFMYRAL